MLREQVGLYDRQLQAWLKTFIGQLVELYEVQAEILREQVRRLAEDWDNVEAGSEMDELHTALQELQMTGTLEKPLEEQTWVQK